MNSYLICYDLLRPGQNYDTLIEKIKSLGTWCHAQQSVWIIKTTKNSVQIRDSLTPFIDQNDKLLIMGLTGEAAWTGFEITISDWLKRHL
ncbi:MAG: SinR family protein [Candidatus Marinimicrobia bacterium]|nr:SinR family protein [Candidatus Neomarinimicrobiota bacterium]